MEAGIHLQRQPDPGILFAFLPITTYIDRSTIYFDEAMDLSPEARPLLAAPNERHLLEEPLSALSLKERLPAGSALAALGQLRQWLAELVELTQCPPEHWLHMIEQIDKLAEHHQLRLVPQYLDAQRMRKLGESELWRTTFGYWEQLGNAYLRCLLRYQAAPDKARDFRPRLPLLLTRLLNTLGRQYEWTLLRYAHVEDRIWRGIGQCHLLAESWGIAERRCVLRDGRPGESTPKQELLKTLMLAMATPDTLPQTQLYIAKRVSAYLSQHFTLHSTAGPGCTFCFDLSLHQPPSRAQGGRVATTAPLRRFFGAGTSALALQKLIAQAQQQGALPRELGLGSEFSQADILATLHHLERQWAESRPARRSEREPSTSRMTVLPGMLPALRWLGQLQENGKSETPIPTRAESWVITDRSEGGFGAVLPAQPADWLAIGTLIVTRPESSGVTRMGLLRRITTEANEQCHIGVELIGQQAVRVMLRSTIPHQDEGHVPDGQSAILLSLRPDAQNAVELLLPLDTLKPVRSLQMQLGTRSFRIESPELVEQGRDYRRVCYRLLPHS